MPASCHRAAAARAYLQPLRRSGAAGRRRRQEGGWAISRMSYVPTDLDREAQATASVWLALSRIARVLKTLEARGGDWTPAVAPPVSPPGPTIIPASCPSSANSDGVRRREAVADRLICAACRVTAADARSRRLVQRGIIRPARRPADGRSSISVSSEECARGFRPASPIRSARSAMLAAHRRPARLDGVARAWSCALANSSSRAFRRRVISATCASAPDRPEARPAWRRVRQSPASRPAAPPATDRGSCHGPARNRPGSSRL